MLHVILHEKKYIGSFHPLIQLVEFICKLKTRIFFTFCMRPIHSLQKLFPFALSTQSSKGEKQFSPSVCYQIFGLHVMESV